MTSDDVLNNGFDAYTSMREEDPDRIYLVSIPEFDRMFVFGDDIRFMADLLGFSLPPPPPSMVRPAMTFDLDDEEKIKSLLRAIVDAGRRVAILDLDDADSPWVDGKPSMKVYVPTIAI